MRHRSIWPLAAAVAVGIASPALAQRTSGTLPTGVLQPTQPTEEGEKAVRITPDPAVGSAAGLGFGVRPLFGGAAGAPLGVIGGRPGPSTAFIPRAVSRPSMTPQPRFSASLSLPPVAPADAAGGLALGLSEAAFGEQGPPDGLTLEAAVERLVSANLELQARALAIPMARADVLTAGLRANPIFYTDAQYLRYTNVGPQNSVDPVQLAFNITYPLDLTNKRRARVRVANWALDVVEADYQDIVRLQVSDLQTAWVNLLAARATLRLTEESIRRLEDLRKDVAGRQGKAGEPEQVRKYLDVAEFTLLQARENYRSTLATLAVLLNTPPGEVDNLDVRAGLRVPTPELPPEQCLIELALANRPDVATLRLAVERGQANVELARTSRLQDAYLLVQPLTHQLPNPGTPKATNTFAVGVSVPLPVYDRNQGNIQHARLHVQRTRLNLAALERRVAGDVQQAAGRYRVDQAVVKRYEEQLLPEARRQLATVEKRWQNRELDLATYLGAQQDLADLVEQYRDALVRLRRSMLNLNTTIGARVVP